MEIGASSACFYPEETEKSLAKIGELGFKHCEIFFNSPSELDKSFVRELYSIKESYGMTVTSLHPFRSFSEGYDFFSRYKRRFYDGVESYKRLFDAASELGAKYIVMHGSKQNAEISTEEYAERFARLDAVAKQYGCRVAHENVVDYIGASPEFMHNLRTLLGGDFNAVLDIKQARRSCVDPYELINVLKDSIVHVHLSDYTSRCDCAAPDENGLFCFEELFTALKGIGYRGDGIIELYSDGFRDKNEIVSAAAYLRKISDKVFNQPSAE